MVNIKRSPIWELSKEELVSLIETNDSITDILNAIGASRKGGASWRAFKIRTQLENIDLNDFLARSKNKRSKQASSISGSRDLKDVLKISSTYNRSYLKKRLIKEGILDLKCAICGNDGTWQGKPISLQLDHINGISNDNRIENLRILCPNCHSQTENFSGKNISKRKEKFLCPDCGVEIRKDSTYCVKCSKVHNRKVDRPNREDLVSIVEKYGYSETGRQYGVSDNTIRKWLK